MMEAGTTKASGGAGTGRAAGATVVGATGAGAGAIWVRAGAGDATGADAEEVARLKHEKELLERQLNEVAAECDRLQVCVGWKCVRKSEEG